MPTKWNPNWTDSQKQAYREKRRRKYALRVLQAGKHYASQADRRDAQAALASDPELSMEATQKVQDVLAEAIRRKLREE